MNGENDGSRNDLETIRNMLTVNAEARRIALQDAHDVCDRLVAPTGGGTFSQGWIAAREKCLTVIRNLSRDA